MPQFILSEHELRTLVQETAGRASVPFMQRNRNLVMPTEELTEGCDEILKDKFGINPLPEMNAGMSMDEEDARSVPTGAPPRGRPIIVDSPEA